MKSLQVLGWLHGLWPAVEAAVFQVANASYAASQLQPKLHARDKDPSDFSWVKRWAAVGDSFTAGIGSGSPLGSFLTDEPGNTNWYCARYDTAYPMIINEALGGCVENFQFVACSGDRTGNIYKQIQELDGKLHLVVMTAGGNDLCLACNDVISIAEKNLDNILPGNLKQLLDALNDKMNDNSIVVFNGYAQFFNTENEDCATKQDWTLFNLLAQSGLKLTVERRKKFNSLVVKINSVIKKVVDDAKKNKKYKYKIGFSDWDSWPSQGVAGQFCDPSSTGEYPDPKQPDLQFFKPDTRIGANGELKKRRREALYATYDNETIWQHELTEAERRRRSLDEIYKSLLYHSVNPQAEARHMLDRRNPLPPKCPGDTDAEIQPPSIGLPNDIAKNFHPNELGHYTIASWALQTMIDLRAEVLGVKPPECVPVDKFTCWQETGSQKYSNEPFLNAQKDDFCDGVEEGDRVNGWSYAQSYGEGTPDETEFKVTLGKSGAGSDAFSKAECKDSIDRIINGCDGNDPENPMDWKFGGEWQRGRFTYQVNPSRTNRPWPVPTAPSGSCKGWWHGVWSSYVIRGKGWATNDFGRKALEPSARSCIGGGLTLWRFKYFDEPDDDGNEWQADFNTPIWVRARCFKNNKVQFEAGGFTDGCGGND
ncbi:uncharacterized protein THITE_2053289 [Thermothielavioides terrestris NRRL 8126]|uniref:SGNH hydrolase-type esterase domain-containing protein n=1 Tax=Thermothielavioides terrestris (strain ATCC 38088 / NRRL 8126) TaxID=578455 RepID=G2R9D3_THETT|nr:uncharacterized protein THITE_2053289 [Thermothielavioides terrestris NRRL 8126]AEO68674.1 hypothetical protein THITE_2053289 [Thermothielavioides terrestris NRRL 8126]